jgi:hypothetical protein
VGVLDNERRLCEKVAPFLPPSKVWPSKARPRHALQGQHFEDFYHTARDDENENSEI